MGKARVTPSEVWLKERLIKKAVKNEKYVIQDTVYFSEWAKQDTSAIAFSYIFIEDFEIPEKFLKVACENLQAVTGTNLQGSCRFFSKSEFDFGPRYVIFLQKLF